MQDKNITIISLGWLGKKLYRKLEKNNQVSGSYLNEEKVGFNSFHYDFNKDQIHKNIANSDIIIFNIPPSRITDTKRFRSFISKLSQKKIILISSTSVYGENGSVDENTALNGKTENALKLIALEDKLKEHHNDYIIIRPGGLYDQRRHPGKFLSGKDVQVGSEERINLISGDDLVEIIIKSCICK